MHSNKEMETRQKIRRGIILFLVFLFPAIFYYLSPVLIIQASSKGIINYMNHLLDFPGKMLGLHTQLLTIYS